ncbi:MAG: hypothetical protein PHW60_15415 [Kiritimatiellae bacterium]|nr:hypothetical protein [Kiritimatiellia bacterium]
MTRTISSGKRICKGEQGKGWEKQAVDRWLQAEADGKIQSERKAVGIVVEKM